MSRPNAAKITLGSHYVRGYLQGALQQGYNLESLLDQANISRHQYESPDEVIDGEQFQRLILTIRDSMNDHYMGFLKVPGKLAMDMKAGLAAINEESLSEGLVQLGDFINAVRSDEERECLIDNVSSEFSFVFRFSGFIDQVDPHLLYFYRLYWGYKYYCWLIGEKIRLSRVCFTAPKFEQSIDYENVFNCPVEFSQPSNRICFNAKQLNKPIIRDEIELFNQDFPLNYPNLFTIPGDDRRLSNQVEQILIELYQEDIVAPSLEVVARILAKSSRTLSRRLQEEDTSFQKIKSKVRCDHATKLLSTTAIPIADIATKVGFSEPGDFTRAFVGWLGLSPSSYREQHNKMNCPNGQ